ncbi:MAG: M48 family metallopeptidase [Burkholderiales bacterium]|nr:M48 family metallopeptidase [Burkholderiales bacterium]
MADSPYLYSPSWILTAAFTLSLVIATALKVWLGIRQAHHVALHRNEVPKAFSLNVNLSSHQKAADYTVAKIRVGLLELAMGVIVLVAWTLLGGLSALNAALLQWLGTGMIQQIALLASFVLISGVLDLPLALYQTFVIEERFGFNKMTIRLWLIDLAKSCLIGTLVGLPIATLILWLMGAAGSEWWLWAWCVWMGFNLLLLLVYPSFIAPLFNKFTPLDDQSLKSSVTALMQRCGFTAQGLFVMDGSKRSARANAYFTGFGAAKRVVFYDTLLAKLSVAEVDAVLAHELGHFRHWHIGKRILMMFGLSLLCFSLVGWLATQVWFYQGLGVDPNLNTPNDALALLLFMLSLPVFGFFLTPIFAALSRRHEFEADAYAVAMTSGPDLCTALLKLYEDNASTLTPDPVYAKVYYSHPPASERLARITFLTG